jgi:hypothetical protein
VVHGIDAPHPRADFCSDHTMLAPYRLCEFLTLIRSHDGSFELARSVAGIKQVQGS